jgi:GNAT superfamily N-acetyltransferase
VSGSQIVLHRVEDDAAGHALIQSVLNHARQYVDESFGHKLVGIEGRQIFEMLRMDVDASERRVYAIELKTCVTRTVGFVTLGLGYPHWMGGYVHFLVLDDRYRGHGYARQAMGLLEGLALAQTDKIRLKVYPPVGEVAAFWGALGYVQTGRFPVGFVPLPNAPADYAMLEKQLRVGAAPRPVAPCVTWPQPTGQVKDIAAARGAWPSRLACVLPGQWAVAPMAEIAQGDEVGTSALH